MVKGTMALIDAEQAESLYASMPQGIETSGGSAGNTAAGLASLGARCAFIGKVRDDQLGDVFTDDIRAVGAEFATPSATDGPPTARCLILITPDAQRTMNTFLGASVNLGPEDIDERMIARAKVTYLEGYLWDRDEAKVAFHRAAEFAHSHNRMVSLSLSDPFCVDRHRNSFRTLVANHVDILFANEDEITSLYEVDDFEAALQHVSADCRIAALTRSEKGAVVVSGDEVHVVGAVPVSGVVDTTGAGDQFAAGFLCGFTRGDDLATCARIGAITAGEVIEHIGPRPQVNLAELVSARLAS
ncbi:MAG: adenosine kinase [Alphaproteobacteria bacterium]|nr:adenosine kinase [Alphaproteobacteria bacterium]HCP01682.1 adenosine kinase [Rhodospirillaceae bacterium]